MSDKESEEFFIYHGHIHKIPKQYNLDDNINSKDELKGEKIE